MRQLCNRIIDRHRKRSEVRSLVKRLVKAGETNIFEVFHRVVGSGVQKDLAIDAIAEVFAELMR